MRYIKKYTSNKIFLNYIYSVIYQILAIIIPFVTTPYVSRVLGVAGMGQYSYYYAVTHYFILFAMLGIYNYANREIALVSDNKMLLREKFWSIYLFQLFTSFCIIIIYIVYVTWFDFSILSKIFLLMVMSSLFDVTWYFQGIEKFKITITRNAIIKILSTMAIFIFVKDTNDLSIYCIISSISILLSQIVLWIFAVSENRIVKVTLKSIYKHFKPCLLLFFPVIAVNLYKYMDKIMLEILAGYMELGFYEGAEKINQLPTVFIIALGTVMLPRMSNLYSKGKENEVKKYIDVSMIFTAFLSSALCFGLLGISNEFVPFFLGADYTRSSEVLKILLPSSLFIASANVIRTQILIPLSHDKVYIVSVVLGAITNMIFNALLIPSYEAIGAAVGTLVAEAVVCVVQYIFVLIKYGRNFLKIKNIVPYYIFGLIMYVILKWMPLFDISKGLQIALKIIVGTISYLVLVAIYIFLNKKCFKKDFNDDRKD